MPSAVTAVDLFNPGTLWTAAHHKIPMLYILQNNRACHQEYMYLVTMAARHGRDVDKTAIGTTNHNYEYRLRYNSARYGCLWRRTRRRPKDLGPALARAVALVKRGETAVVDVVTDAR